MQKNVYAENTPEKRNAVLELTVNNHPGVMSHICGLFSRRAYNLEAIVCVPLGDGRLSRMWLEVNDEMRLNQIEKQVEKLPDVLGLTRHPLGHEVFARVRRFGTCPDIA